MFPIQVLEFSRRNVTLRQWLSKPSLRTVSVCQSSHVVTSVTTQVSHYNSDRDCFRFLWLLGSILSDHRGIFQYAPTNTQCRNVFILSEIYNWGLRVIVSQDRIPGREKYLSAGRCYQYFIRAPNFNGNFRCLWTNRPHLVIWKPKESCLKVGKYDWERSWSDVKKLNLKPARYYYRDTNRSRNLILSGLKSPIESVTGRTVT